MGAPAILLQDPYSQMSFCHRVTMTSTYRGSISNPLADPIRMLGSDQHCSRSQKRIVNHISPPGVVHNWPAHDLHRLLRPVSGRRFASFRLPERIQIGYVPQRRLTAIPAPLRRTALPHRILY